MTVKQLRWRVGILWCGFWVLTTACVLLAPILGSGISSEHVPGLLAQISGIWLPPLSCFIAFWFPVGARAPNARRAVETEQALATLGLTLVYMCLVFVLLLSPLYFGNYDMDAQGHVAKPLADRITDVVKYALLASPVVSVPVGWLTGGNA